VEDHPDHKLAADARFNLGMAFKRLDLQVEARQAYESVIEHYPQTDLAFRAQMRIGYMLQDAHHDPEAIEAFTQVVTNAPPELAAEAQFWIADIYGTRKESATAQREFLKVADKYPKESRWAVTALARVAELQENAGEFEAAIDTYKRIARSAPEKRWKQQAKARIQLIQEKLDALNAPPAAPTSTPPPTGGTHAP